jgi:hypothetical protein
MNIATQYDWIVLGDHPAALLSANLVARLGLSVLIVPQCTSMQTCVSEEQRVLDPESNFLLGLEPDGLLGICLEKSGLSMKEHLLPDSLPQALTPENRIRFRATAEEMKTELQRELSKDSSDVTETNEEAAFLDYALRVSPELLSHWVSFPKQLTLDMANAQAKRPKLVDWQEVLRKSPALRMPHVERAVETSSFLEAFRFGLSGQSLQGGASPLESLHALSMGPSGSSVRGGMKSYRELLLRNAKRLGVTVLENAQCKRIFVENGRFVGVQVSESGNMVGGSGCVLGSSFDEFSERVSMNGRNWLSLKRQWPDASGWKFSLAFTVGEEAIPPGASRRMIWKEPEAPIVEFEIADASEYGIRDREKKLIFLRTILSYNEESLSSDFQKMIAARMFRLASQVLPYLEYHVISIYPDFRVEDLKRVYPFNKLSEIPENLKSYGRRTGLAHLLQGSGTGIEGLFISSNQSFPELGNFGPTLAALEAVAWIAHRLGLPGPLA